MRRRDERGSSLLLVLVVITVIATALSALLSRADSAQRVARSLSDQTVASYAADGAMDAAINNLRNSTYSGKPGQRCFGLSDTLSLVLFNGLDSAAVTCAPGIQLTAYICPGALLCAPSGRPALQARIGLADADPEHPVAGRRTVTVLGWWRAG